MNSKRSANRRMSMRSGKGDGNFAPPASGKKYVSHDSPASVGASVGPGPVAGAGELNAPGAFPGRAAGRMTGMATSEFPTRATTPGGAPPGMKIYRQE